MATLRSLLNSIGISPSQADPNSGAPSRLAIMSGGVITVSLVVLLLIV